MVSPLSNKLRCNAEAFTDFFVNQAACLSQHLNVMVRKRGILIPYGNFPRVHGFNKREANRRANLPDIRAHPFQDILGDAPIVEGAANSGLSDTSTVPRGPPPVFHLLVPGLFNFSL